MPAAANRTAALLVLALAATLPTLIPVGQAQAEVAVAPEKNPPGDIPDSQAFVTYVSEAGYTLQVPEGWARTEAAGNVAFVDKLDGLSVTLTPTPAAPPTAALTPAALTVEWTNQHYLPAMIQSGRAVKIASVTAETMPGGPAIRIVYAANSDPNPVTTKQVRLESNRYLFFKGGSLAALDLYAPLGADNVDQWRLMSQSFAWR